MIRPKGLGRGLDALLTGFDAPGAKDALQALAIGRLQPGRYQPRTQMDEAALDELAASVREHGVMQPILVRPIEGGRFEIVAGERRWRGTRVDSLPPLQQREAQLAMQMIFQDPYASLNPRYRIGSAIAEPIRFLKLLPPDAVLP